VTVALLAAPDRSAAGDPERHGANVRHLGF
jgi:hypothetical protein